MLNYLFITLTIFYLRTYLILQILINFAYPKIINFCISQSYKFFLFIYLNYFLQFPAYVSNSYLFTEWWDYRWQNLTQLHNVNVLFGFFIQTILRWPIITIIELTHGIYYNLIYHTYVIVNIFVAMPLSSCTYEIYRLYVRQERSNFPISAIRVCTNETSSIWQNSRTFSCANM